MSDLKIYKFGPVTDGDATMKEILGGKGANLAEMAKMGIKVPVGFTIPCEASVAYQSEPVATMLKVFPLLTDGMAYIKASMGGDQLVSVRSGARVSMPGMMDTILNVGITSETLPAWKKKLGDVVALDSYRRLIQMYGSVALGVEMKFFEAALESAKSHIGVKFDSELTKGALEALVMTYLDIVKTKGVLPMPDTAEEQLKGAVSAVFQSWDNPRAIEYRKINNIPDDWGTAVTVQSMVFGNMNDNSATGVLFSRDPATGAKGMVGEFLINAQGEDVVAGIRTPLPLSKMHGPDKVAPGFGTIHHDLGAYALKLETHFKDMQDIEFTVQDGKLYILQTRNAKRSARAAFNVAYDMANVGLISKADAAKRVTPAQLFSVMQDQIDPSFSKPPSTSGIAAGGGVVSGKAMFTAKSAVNCKEPCILVTKETDPDDIAGMNASVGILTAMGGLTSHAAVVARGMNKSCVVGATNLVVQDLGGGAYSGHIKSGVSFVEGDHITIDGATGRVWVGTKVPLIPGGASDVVKAVVSWGVDTPVADRIELSPSMTLEEVHKAVADSTADQIHIDTVLLETGYGKDDCFKLDNRMFAVLKGLQETKASLIVVDLSTGTDYHGGADAAFDSMFGVSPDDVNAVLECKVQAMAKWPKELASKVVVKVGDKSDADIDALKPLGFRITKPITTFEDLMNAPGPIVASSAVIKKVFGSLKAFEYAKSIVQGSAPKMNLLNPGYWYDPLTKKVG